VTKFDEQSVNMAEKANDLLNRDPNNINEHVKVTFEDIIAEPEETSFSFDGVWLLSYKVFTNTKLWTYRIVTLLCAIPASFCWGVYFACLAFCTIWCWIPGLKTYEIEMNCVSRYYTILLESFLGPVCDTLGRCFSHIVVSNK